MGYTQDQLALKQKALQDYLDQSRSGIDTSAATTKDYLAGQDVKRAANTQDVLSGVSSRFGIDPSIAAAGADFASTQEQGIQNRRDAALGQMKMQKLGNYYNQVFNQKLDEYQAAGYNKSQAEAFARQHAADMVAQAHAADMAASGRDFAQKKADVSNALETQKVALDSQNPPNPYEQAMYRALFGLGTAAIGYEIVNGKKVPINHSSGQTSYQPTYQPNPQELNLNYNAS